MPPRKKKNQLGKSLIRTRFQGQNRPKDDDTNLVRDFVVFFHFRTDHDILIFDIYT